MPIQKDLKRLVRARMRKTGESYTAARARLLEKKREKPTARSKAPGATPRADLAALAGMSDAVVAQKTGRTWKEWVSVLDRDGAAELPHAKIARLLHETHGVPEWWSQMVTVGYERIRGLREKGQRLDGTFDVGKSKTYPVTVAELWRVFMRCKEWLDGETLRMSTARKHKTMRMKWSDGTPVEAYFIEKGPGKSVLSLQHRKLASRAEAARLRTYWSERLVAIGRMLEQS
jgi:hypothetical protein